MNLGSERAANKRLSTPVPESSATKLGLEIVPKLAIGCEMPGHTANAAYLAPPPLGITIALTHDGIVGRLFTGPTPACGTTRSHSSQ